VATQTGMLDNKHKFLSSVAVIFGLEHICADPVGVTTALLHKLLARAIGVDVA